MVGAYDPIAHGARCDLCPLKGSAIVAPSTSYSGRTRLVFVGEAPGRKEEIFGKPFVGQTGVFLRGVLREVDIDIRDAHLTNSALCRSNIDKENERASVCCAPRLLKELAALPASAPIVALGKSAALSVLGTRSIMHARGFVWTARAIDPTSAIRDAQKAKERGAPKAAELRLKAQILQGRALLAGRTVLPTVHPAFVLRSDTWLPILKLDLDRVARLLRSEVRLVDAENYKVVSTRKDVRGALRELGPVVAVDIETGPSTPGGKDGADPLRNRILCVGLSDGARSVVVWPFQPHAHAPLLTRYFARCTAVVMHNGYNFDQIALRRAGVVLRDSCLEDTLLAHHTFASHLPQRLAHVAATYCLFANTPVLLANGRTEKIAKIVANKMPVSVMTLGPSGMEPKKVIGWHRHRVVGQQWIQIRTTDQDGLAHDRAYGRGLIATPDHQVFTERGWLRADAVRRGDRVAVHERALGSIEKGALLGTLLGDSSIARPSKPHASLVKASIVGSHRADVGLAQAKEIAVRGFIRAKEIVVREKSYSKNPQQVYRSAVSRQVLSLVEGVGMYDADGRKRITRAALEALGPAGFAWWFADDGCKAEKGIRIATDGFPIEDVELARAWLSERFGPVSIYAARSAQAILGLRNEAAEAFCAYIAPYLPPCVRYKLPVHRKWPAFVEAPLSTSTEPLFVEVVHAAPYEPATTPSHKARGGRSGDTSYCITVEDNRNFFTPTALVANCDVSPWKITFKRGGGEEKGLPPEKLSAEELCKYNVMDCILTIQSWLRMQPDLESERAVYAADKANALLCRSMIEGGIGVDLVRREVLRAAVKGKASALKGRMRKILRRPDFHPMQLNAVRKALFTTLRAPLYASEPTESGVPSTSSATLERLKGSPTRAGRFADLLLRWRGAMKIKATYLDAQVLDRHRRAAKIGRTHFNWRSYGAGCMPAGELVLTSRGYLEVQDVRVGDLVISHMGVPRPVVGCARNAPATIYKVELSNGLILRTTGDHAYRTTQDEWVRADALKVGTGVVTHANPEEWRHLSDWPYEVSSWGRVRHCGRLKPMAFTKVKPYGHLKVRLCKEVPGDPLYRKEMKVHRLVMAAFDGRGPQVRHVSGIPWDNTIGNLIPGTNYDNRMDSRRHGTASKRRVPHPQRRLTEEIAERIRQESRDYYSDVRLGHELGVCREVIRDIRLGKRWAPETHVEGKRSRFGSAKVVAITREVAQVNYGLVVDVDHSHVTGGIVTHNSGRYSCRLQSCPRAERLKDGVVLETRVREVYIARRGCQLVYFDLSQAEMRVAAYASGDETFIAVCSGDIHSGNAKILFPDEAELIDTDVKGRGKPFRDVAKNAGFGVTYLAEAQTVFAFLRMKGFDVRFADVVAMMERMREAYAGYFRYVADNVKFVAANGYMRSLLAGRVRWLGWHAPPTEVANFPIQSMIADLMNERLPAIAAALPAGCQVVAQIHDAAIIETPNRFVPQVEALVRDTWTRPVVVPAGGRYGGSLRIEEGARSFVMPIDLKVKERWSDL